MSSFLKSGTSFPISTHPSPLSAGDGSLLFIYYRKWINSTTTASRTLSINQLFTGYYY
jgi:hypothetical protein